MSIKTSKNISVVNIKQKLSLFDKHWNPKIVGELNDDKETFGDGHVRLDDISIKK